jgi:hypothetical protein
MNFPSSDQQLTDDPVGSIPRGPGLANHLRVSYDIPLSRWTTTTSEVVSESPSGWERGGFVDWYISKRIIYRDAVSSTPCFWLS